MNADISPRTANPHGSLATGTAGPRTSHPKLPSRVVYRFSRREHWRCRRRSGHVVESDRGASRSHSRAHNPYPRQSGETDASAECTRNLPRPPRRVVSRPWRPWSTSLLGRCGMDVHYPPNVQTPLELGGVVGSGFRRVGDGAYRNLRHTFDLDPAVRGTMGRANCRAGIDGSKATRLQAMVDLGDRSGCRAHGRRDRSSHGRRDEEPGHIANHDDERSAGRPFDRRDHRQ